jgi:serine/threonine-protein kinase
MDWEGTVFGGKYLLGKKLGQGGMGSVWRAQHVQLRSPVAIKLIEQSIAQNPEALARFMREAQSAAALRSPHVVQILDHGADHGVPYIAMELLDGESLANRLERVTRLSPPETATILTQVARAITKAHDAGIVHRDLKPDNVFLVKNDDEEVAKVLDFGIAKQAGAALGPSSSTRTGALLGTPYYMSPEQAEGTRLVDFRTDIWAFGVIAFECLLGRRPFESEAFGSLLLAICTRPLPVPSTFGPVPPEFDAWFARACAREPDRRFASAREAAAELRRACSDGRLSVPQGASPYSHALTPQSHLPQSHTPHAHTPQGHKPGAPTPHPHTPHPQYAPPYSPGAAGPTANPFTASVDSTFRKSRTPLVFGLLAGAVVTGLAAMGVMKLVRGGDAPPVPDAPVAAAAPSPDPPPSPAPAPPPVIEPAAPVADAPAPPASASAPSSAAPAAAPAPARPVAAARPRPGKPARPTSTATPAAAPPPPAPAPPPPPPPTPSKPKFDLGI